MALPSHASAYYTTVSLADGVDTIYFDGTKDPDRASYIKFSPGEPNVVSLAKVGQAGETHVMLGGRTSRTARFTAILDNWTGVTDNAQSRVDKLKLWREASTALTFKCDYLHPLVGDDAHADTLTCVISALEVEEEQGSQPHRYLVDVTLEEDV